MPAIALTGSVEITRRARAPTPPAQVTTAPSAACATLDTVAPGEYVAGWIKRGPTGVVGTNRHDASETVRSLLEVAALLPPPETGDPDAIMTLLHQRGVRVVEWDGWEAIDALEISAGLARNARRVKVADRKRLLAAAFAARAVAPG